MRCEERTKFVSQPSMNDLQRLLIALLEAPPQLFVGLLRNVMALVHAAKGSARVQVSSNERRPFGGEMSQLSKTSPTRLRLPACEACDDKMRSSNAPTGSTQNAHRLGLRQSEILGLLVSVAERLSYVGESLRDSL